MWFVNFDMITINRFQIQSMEVKPKTDILETADALGCVLVHKKGEIVRNFLFPFIKRRVKDDIIRVLFEGDMTRKEFKISRNLILKNHSKFMVGRRKTELFTDFLLS